MISIGKSLYWAERVFLVALVIGIGLAYFQTDFLVLKIALTGLSIIFFLNAFQPIDTPQQGNELPGFLDLLALTIVPKVLWISSAVAVLGILFFLTDLGNQGYKQMLVIGSTTIGMALFLLGFALLNGVKYLTVLIPTLLRAIPVFLISVYILIAK